MAASLITCTGLPSAWRKSNPTQPLPRCFGSLTICPPRTGAGKPIEIASKLQSAALRLICATNCFGRMVEPESNMRRSRGDIRSFTWVPPMSTTRTFFFIPQPSRLTVMLLAGANRALQTLKDALALGLESDARRPTFHNLERKEAEQRQPGKFQIEAQILGDLLNRSAPVKLRSELRFRDGQLQVLDPLETIFGVGGN